MLSNDLCRDLRDNGYPQNRYKKLSKKIIKDHDIFWVPTLKELVEEMVKKHGKNLVCDYLAMLWISLNKINKK